MAREIYPTSPTGSNDPPRPLKTHSGTVLSLAKLRCPRCDCLLTDPRGMGLCPACGYCRSLADRSAPQEVPSKPQKSLGRLGRVFALPAWVWLVLVPVAAVLPICFTADRELVGSSPRALWGLAQLALGLLALFAGQTWAFLILRRQREDVEPLDVLSPFKLWSRAFRWLPTTSGALALASAGLTAVLATLLWVNDLSAWLAHEPSSKNDSRTAQAPDDRKEASQQASERLHVWEMKAQKKEQQSEENQPATILGISLRSVGTGERAPVARPVARCVVTGYMLRGDGQLEKLVLATRRDGKLTDAGVVSAALSAERQVKLLARLEALRRTNPVVEGPPRLAVWVNPVVLCEVWHSGVDAAGLLIEPAVKDIVEE